MMVMEDTSPRKVYEGRRTVNGTRDTGDWIVTVQDNRACAVYELPHEKRHSPDGFAWGYGGSGPSELARCILIDYFGGIDAILNRGGVRDVDDVVPPALYQQFKANVVRGWPMDEPWRCTSDLIDGFLCGADWPRV